MAVIIGFACSVFAELFMRDMPSNSTRDVLPLFHNFSLVLVYFWCADMYSITILMDNEHWQESTTFFVAIFLQAASIWILRTNTRMEFFITIKIALHWIVLEYLTKVQNSVGVLSAIIFSLAFVRRLSCGIPQAIVLCYLIYKLCQHIL